MAYINNQKCHKVRDHAKELGIELLYLPSYSPHLNLIERLWKIDNSYFPRI
jgi:transposase